MADTADQNTDQTADTGSTGDQTGSADTARTFSQADVDRIVQERVARVKSEPPKDYEELKAAKAKLEEIEAANQSELEKAQKAAADAQAERDKVLADAKETRLRSAILAEAAKADRKVVDPNAVVALIDRNTLTLDDEGNPTNIAEAMDELLTAKPYLVAQNGGARGGAADQGARGGKTQIARDQLQNMTPEEIREALRKGELDTVLKGGGS